MATRFGPFELDPEAFELRREGLPVTLEPQVLRLLMHLVGRRGALVSRDELIETVWGGRIVSDAAIASRIRSVREALGDDGTAQRWVKTVHGAGFRFLGDVEADGPTALCAESRPSIAVLPLQPLGPPGAQAHMAHALPHDIIVALGRMRWLSVTARGSSFRLDPGQTDPPEAGRLLGVNYLLTGTLEEAGGRILVSMELSGTADGGLVWAERFEGSPGDVHHIRGRIVEQVVTALDLRIPEHEARMARLEAPDDLASWAAFHLGLQHMYRFTARDTAAAAQLFARALARDPGFARAEAGLSFTHFQEAFLAYGPDTAAAAKAARASAERAVALDPLDPFVNFAMGRCFWLDGRLEHSLGWLERATELCPSYAQGIYATAWTRTLLGDGGAGREAANLAMTLSPIDPLHYAMQATRALSHLVTGDRTEAARWSGRAAAAPGAHVLIAMIAAACHLLDGQAARAERWAGEARRMGPRLDRSDFFRSFPFGDEAARGQLDGALAALGF